MTEPEQVIKDAAAWHDERKAEHEEADEYSGCWCCCIYCETNNPDFARADRCQRGES